MSIEIKNLDMLYCNHMAQILNSDKKLHQALSPNSPFIPITGKEYYDKCKAWESRKNGRNFIILNHDRPIGSISYHTVNNITAGCGYWIESNLWGKGYAKETFSMFLQIIKDAGFIYVTANILKDNVASWKLWLKYTSNFKEDEFRYTPIISLLPGETE